MESPHWRQLLPDYGVQDELLYTARTVTNPGDETSKNADKDCDYEADDAVQVERGRVQHGLPIAENVSNHKWTCMGKI